MVPYLTLYKQVVAIGPEPVLLATLKPKQPLHTHTHNLVAVTS